MPLLSPATLQTRLVPKTLLELLNNMHKAKPEEAPWYEELERIHQLPPAADWLRLVSEYTKYTNPLRVKDVTKTSKDLTIIARTAQDAWEGLLVLDAVRRRYLLRIQKLPENAGVPFEELMGRSALVHLLSPFSRDELQYYKARGLDLEASSATSHLSSAPSTLSSSDNTAVNGNSISPSDGSLRATSPPSSLARIVLPATLQTRLIPRSLNDLLMGYERIWGPIWTIELEAIHDLVPASQWARLEVAYGDLKRRWSSAMRARDGKGDEWMLLQREEADAWTGIMHLHDIRRRYLEGARRSRWDLTETDLLAAPISLHGGPAVSLSPEEKAFYAENGHVFPSSRPRSPSPTPATADPVASPAADHELPPSRPSSALSIPRFKDAYAPHVFAPHTSVEQESLPAPSAVGDLLGLDFGASTP